MPANLNSTNVLIIPVVTSALFLASKIAEMKFIDKDIKPLKVILRDTLIVFISSLTATYILFNFSEYIQEFMNVVTDSKINPVSVFGGGGAGVTSTEIFTDTPNF
jgi:hypothetical protein